MTLRAGRLRHRVTIQKPTEGTANAFGETVDTWSDVATVHASVIMQTGREAFEAAKVQPEGTVEVIVRYRSDLTSEKRFKFGDRLLFIDNVIADDRRRQQTCLCHEDL